MEKIYLYLWLFRISIKNYINYINRTTHSRRLLDTEFYFYGLFLFNENVLRLLHLFIKADAKNRSVVLLIISFQFTFNSCVARITLFILIDKLYSLSLLDLANSRIRLFLNQGRDSHKRLGFKFSFTAVCYIDTGSVKVLNGLNGEFNPVFTTWCDIIQCRNCDSIPVFTEFHCRFISVLCARSCSFLLFGNVQRVSVYWLWKVLIDGQYLTKFGNIWEMGYKMIGKCTELEKISVHSLNICSMFSRV